MTQERQGGTEQKGMEVGGAREALEGKEPGMKEGRWEFETDWRRKVIHQLLSTRKAKTTAITKATTTTTTRTTTTMMNETPFFDTGR